jgi:hypothetical protein
LLEALSALSNPAWNAASENWVWAAFFELLRSSTGVGRCGLNAFKSSQSFLPTWTVILDHLGLAADSPPADDVEDPPLGMTSANAADAVAARERLRVALVSVANSELDSATLLDALAALPASHDGNASQALPLFLARLTTILSLARRKAAALFYWQASNPAKATPTAPGPEWEVVLESLPLTRSLTLDHIAELWSLIGRSNPTLDEGRAKTVVQQIRASTCLFLFDKITTTLKGLPAPPDQTFVDAVLEGLSVSLKASALMIGDDQPATSKAPDPGRLPASALGPLDPVETPQPLAVVVGPMQQTETAMPGSDLLVRLSGVGVLVRLAALPGQADSPWQCLTLGTVAYSPNADTPIWCPVPTPGDSSHTARQKKLQPLRLDTGLASWRIVSQSGLTGWIISYDGLPITAKPLLADLHDTVLQNDRNNSDPWEDMGIRIVQVNEKDALPPALPTHSWRAFWKTYPALGYGRIYEFAFFVRTEGGALPSELTSDDPCVLVLPETPVTVPTMMRARYLRRTRVSAPRLLQPSSPNAAATAFQAPVINRSGEFAVYPLAEDMIGNSGGSSPSHDTLGQLVLLRPNDSSWAEGVSSIGIAVAPPRVSLEDYLRWQYADPVLNRNDITNVLKCHSDAAKLASSSTESLAVDDPASRSFYVKVTQMRGTSPSIASKCFTFPAANRAAKLLGPWQAPPVRLQISVGSAQEAWDLATNTLYVPPGAIWHVDIASLVQTDLSLDNDLPGSPARFRSVPTIDGCDNRISFGGRTYHVAGSVRLTVEVATPVLPKADELWDSITAIAATPDELLVGFDPDWDLSSSFYNTKRVQLDRQLWSWSGRLQVAPLAASAGVLPGLAGHNWTLESEGDQYSPAWDQFAARDAEWFADRPDTDCITVIGWLPHLGVRLAAAQDSCSYAIQLSDDRRAQYWRFSAILTSRYAGLMTPSVARAVSQLQDVGQGPWGAVRTRWKRLIVKARPVRSLSKPRLRFILPLMQPIQKKSKAGVAPVLVMLDEQWGIQGGFAEKLEAQVVLFNGARREDGSSSFKRSLLQIGRDPIVSTTSVMLTESDRSSLLDLGETPLGLTFDYDANRPLPATTCFELSLKDVGLDDTSANYIGPAPDMMAQLQFRRALHTPLAQLSANTDVGLASSFFSEWTPGEWVIFNADSSLWNVEGKGLLHVSKLYPGIHGGIVDANGEPAHISGSPVDQDSKLARMVFVLTTELVVDIGGNVSSERFKSVSATTVGTLVVNGSQPPVPTNIRLRLLEVEFLVGTSLTADNLWQFLFPEPNNRVATDDLGGGDVQARIRRVSPPLGEIDDAYE